MSLMAVGAAPVPPLKPSIAMMSAPLRAIPLAIAEMLWTDATFTMTGFLYPVASLRDITSCLKSSIE